MTFCMLKCVRKATSYMYAYGQTWLWPFMSWDSKICFMSRINWWIGLILCMLEVTNNFCLDHWSCSVSLTFKYWTLLRCSCICYLLRRLLNIGLPQSLSHSQYCTSYLILYLSTNHMLPLVILDFPYLTSAYFLVSCCC